MKSSNFRWWSWCVWSLPLCRSKGSQTPIPELAKRRPWHIRSTANDLAVAAAVAGKFSLLCQNGKPDLPFGADRERLWIRHQQAKQNISHAEHWAKIKHKLRRDNSHDSKFVYIGDI